MFEQHSFVAKLLRLSDLLRESAEWLSDLLAASPKDKSPKDLDDLEDQLATPPYSTSLTNAKGERKISLLGSESVLISTLLETLLPSLQDQEVLEVAGTGLLLKHFRDAAVGAVERPVSVPVTDLETTAKVQKVFSTLSYVSRLREVLATGRVQMAQNNLCALMCAPVNKSWTEWWIR